MSEIKSTTATDSVLVCSLPAPDLATRRAEINEFIRGAISVNATPAGIVFIFENAADIAHALIDFILFEQKCCSSILYELRSSPPHAQLTLQLHAPRNQVDALHAIYLDERLGSSQLTRPTEVAHRFGARLDKICETAGPFGALACATICLGIPVVSAALGLVGVGFIRNDRLLIPGEFLCCSMLLWSLIKSWRSHGKSVVMWLGSCAIGAFFGSLFFSGMESKISVGVGFVVLSASLLLNRHFSLMCSCPGKGPDKSTAPGIETPSSSAPRSTIAAGKQERR
jgi:hypothetical protein